MARKGKAKLPPAFRRNMERMKAGEIGGKKKSGSKSSSKKSSSKKTTSKKKR
jgi:hypothetical protein